MSNSSDHSVLSDHKTKLSIEKMRTALNDNFDKISDLSNKFTDDLINQKMLEIARESHKQVETLTEKEILALIEYFPKRIGALEWNLEKTKVMLLLYRSFNKDGIEKILSFLQQTEYGWHNGEYKLRNSCFEANVHCRRMSPINSLDAIKDILTAIRVIFFDRNFGNITLYIFSYCLAALFSSKLNKDGFQVPYYLQIACDKNSALYELIQEIVKITDVNVGIIDECRDDYHNYGTCGYQHITHYPTYNLTGDMDYLIANQDVPIIIDGYENERYYLAMLRDVSNIPNKKRPLEIRDRFNFLPIFVCPAIESSFNNVFDMDLTGVTMSKEYLGWIKDHRRILASWVLSLVKDPNIFFQIYDDDRDVAKQKKRPFSFGIAKNVNHVRIAYAETLPKDAVNIGFLTFFFKGYLEVFKRQITIPYEEAFIKITGRDKPVEIERYIDSFIPKANKSLSAFHKSYSPVPMESVINNTMKEPDTEKADHRNRKALNIAKRIVRLYQKYKVLIRITKIEVKDDRFVFGVHLVPGTESEQIFKRAGNIQLLLNQFYKLDFFYPVKDGASISIVVSESLLEDNSLSQILESPLFADKKMKIPYAIGYDTKGDMRVVDVDDFPHILIAGTTGSGKSTALECMLMSIAYKHRTGDVRVLVFDLGVSNLSLFKDMPFLLEPIITDTKTGFEALMRLKTILDARNEVYHSSGRRSELGRLPWIVCIVDEFPMFFSDIIDKKQKAALNNAITSLVRLGRNAKIHMVFATQDPSRKNMDAKNCAGISNIPAKLALRTANPSESINILGHAAAFKLRGRGAMILNSPNVKIDSLQMMGSYISEADIKMLLEEIRKTYKPKNDYTPEVSAQKEPVQGVDDELSYKPSNSKEIRYDSQLAKAISMSVHLDKIAVSHIQNECNAGHPVAVKIMGELYNFGLVGGDVPYDGRATLYKGFDNITNVNALEVLKRNGYIKETFTAVTGKESANRQLQSSESDERHIPASDMTDSSPICEQTNNVLHPDTNYVTKTDIKSEDAPPITGQAHQNVVSEADNLQAVPNEKPDNYPAQKRKKKRRK